jgi:iron complex outermembrane receptor protein
MALNSAFKSKLTASTAAFVLLTQLSAATAYSQDTTTDGNDAELDEIIVTGSRIKRQGFDTLQPAVVLDRQTMEARGLSNVGDALSELPAFGVPSSNATGAQAGVGAGQNFINFFGLGSQRSLTLVNGHRFVPANTPSVDGSGSPGLQVDLNTIPVALVERVETIAIGGAPIYGTDAIAGTVNIIMKKDFEGFEAMGKVGLSELGGAEEYQAQATYGFNFNDDRGNIVVSFDHNQRAGLSAADRPITAEYLSFEAPVDPNSPYDAVLIRDSRVGLTNFNGVILGVPFQGTGVFPGPHSIDGKPAVPFGFNLLGGALYDADGNMTQFAPNGDIVTFDPGTPTGSLVFKGGGDGFSIGNTGDLLTDNKRQLANVMVNYKLTDTTNLHMEGWYSHTRDTSLTSQPYFTGVAFQSGSETLRYIEQGPAPIRLSNPFVTDQARAILSQGLDFDGDGSPDLNADYDGDGVADDTIFWVDKGHQDIMRGSPTTSTQNLYRALISFDGVVTLGGEDYDWDVNYSYGQTVGKSTATVINSRRFSAALYATRDADGNIVCEDSSLTGCVPLNIMGDGAPSDEAIDYVSGPASAVTKIDQHFVSANLSGSLFDMPAGQVGFAVGAYYRSEASKFEPDEVLQSGEVQSFAIQSGTPIEGSFNSKEIYGELLVPVVSPDMDIPLVRAVELEGAFRYVDNSVAGGDVTWTAGARYFPVEGLMLRGNYTQSIRAPGITELFLPPSDTSARASDPCDQRFIDGGAQPATRAANCAAAGIDQPFNSLIVNASQPQTISGNPNLVSEQAKSWTVGAVIRPTFMPGLTLAVDWVDIRLDNAIENLGGTQILEGCYDSAEYPTAAACSLITRDSLGQVTHISAGYVNAGLRDFAGLTADLSYYYDMDDYGSLGLSVNYFHLDKLVTSVTGSDLNFDAGEVGNSKHRVTANLRYNLDKFSANLQMRYLGSAVFDNADSPTSKDVLGIGSWSVFNVSTRYQVNENVSVQFNVDNVFGDEPPQFATAHRANGTGTYFSGILGRTFALTVRTSF